MDFHTFAQFLSSLEKTTKRLEITAILAEMIEKLEPLEVDKAVYLSLGKLGPLFDQVDFAIADKMMLKILVASYSISDKEVSSLYEKEGDLGNVAFILASKENPKNKSDLRISEVFDSLKGIALISGVGSQEKKINDFAKLLKRVEPLSAKYAVRIPLGLVRLGFSEITIIEALSWSEKKDKSLKSEIESYFHLHPDIGLIAKLFKKNGLKGLSSISLEVGVPVLPQLCQRVGSANEVIEKMKRPIGAEYKFDGTRVQLHFDKRKGAFKEHTAPGLFDEGKGKVFVRTFTRNLEDSTQMFPDLIQAALSDIDAEAVILDGEAVGVDPKSGKLIPFQETMQRKRKHNILEKASEIKLKFYLFDLLYLDGKPLLDKPLYERRALLKRVLRKNDTLILDDQREIGSSEDLLTYFAEAKAKGLEGLVLKSLDSTYEAGGRGFSWIKFKREGQDGLEDTIDGVILGYYHGKGARVDLGIGGFLVGIYDKENDCYLTVCKVGSGPSEEEWRSLKKMVDSHKALEKPETYVVGKALLADVWARPKYVVVIRADEITVSEVHSAGYALRFPRLVQFRNDKGVKDITTLKELVELFKIQRRAKK